MSVSGCRFRMTQSKIIPPTDAMFAIVDASNLRHDSHCSLEDVLRNIHKHTLKPDRGMKVSTGDNVWYGQTNFVRIQRNESTLRPCSHYLRPSTDLIDFAWGTREMHCGAVRPFGSGACVRKLRNVQLCRPIRSQL